MTDLELIECKAVRANININLRAICKWLRTDIARRIDSLQVDLERYKNRQRLDKLKENIGGLLFDLQVDDQNIENN